VYLDQLAISNLAKTAGGSVATTPEEGFWAGALERLRRLHAIQVIACPVSNFHMEESLPSRLGEDLTSMARQLAAEVRFHDYEDIRRVQLFEHARWRDRRARRRLSTPGPTGTRARAPSVPRRYVQADPAVEGPYEGRRRPLLGRGRLTPDVSDPRCTLSADRR